MSRWTRKVTLSLLVAMEFSSKFLLSNDTQQYCMCIYAVGGYIRSSGRIFLFPWHTPEEYMYYRVLLRLGTGSWETKRWDFEVMLFDNTLNTLHMIIAQCVNFPYAHAYYISRDTTVSSRDTHMIITLEHCSNLKTPSCLLLRPAGTGKRKRYGFGEGILRTCAVITGT